MTRAPRMLPDIRGSREITQVETNHAVGEIPGRIASKCDGRDLFAMPIEELLRNVRDIPRRSSKLSQCFESDGAEYLYGTISQREVDGVPHSISNSN